jgi:HEAT repeat protein
VNQAKSQIYINNFIFARACVCAFVNNFIGLNRSTGLIALTFGLLVSVGYAESKTSKNLVTVHTLEEALQSSDSSERLMATSSIGKAGAELSSEKISLLQKEENDPLVRHRLNQAMAENSLTNQGVELVASLQNDKDPMVRQGAAQMLGNYVYNLDAVKSLVRALEKDSDAGVRYACALSLALSKTSEAFQALEKAAKDTDPNLRRQVAFSLHRHPAKKAQKILKQMQKDSDESVRMMAGAEK